MSGSPLPRYAAWGNLRFPIDQPIPYDLIERIVKLRVRQNLAKGQRPTGLQILIETSGFAGT